VTPCHQHAVTALFVASLAQTVASSPGWCIIVISSSPAKVYWQRLWIEVTAALGNAGSLKLLMSSPATIVRSVKAVLAAVAVGSWSQIASHGACACDIPHPESVIATAFPLFPRPTICASCRSA
jgi:hypothetical protein